MNKALLLLALLTSQITFAQKSGGKLSGKAIDGTTKEALSFGTVGVYKTFTNKDSLITGMNLPETGEFSFSNLPQGKLIFKISFVGYQSVNQTLNLTNNDLNLGLIEVFTDSKMLQEVDVKAEKDPVSFGMDKRTFNVAKSITSLGGTAEALLRNVPSINIDESGNPTLRNMATTIYINGKPTQLTLAQIPANQIESVEVISNPSAKYEASTSGGIVNLVLKKNRANGFNGTVSAGVGNNSRLDGSLYLSYHLKKWNFTAQYNVNATKNPLNGYVNRITSVNGVPVSYFNQNTNISLDNLFQNGRLEADYSTNKYNTFSLAGTYVSGAFNQFSSQQYDYLNAQNAITSFGGRNTVPANTFTNLGIELDWKKTFERKGRELNLKTSYVRNNLSNAANWLTTAQNADSTNQAGFPVNNKVAGNQLGNQYLVQLDYVHPLNDSTKFEMGLRSFNVDRDQQYLFNLLNPDTKIYDLLVSYSQNANILQSINAAYFLYNHRFAHKITLETGLRVEQSFLHGISRFDNSTFGYDYPSANSGHWTQIFFPSLSLSKKISEDSQLGISLTRKIGRPNFRQIFVGIQANDRQNITVGNPNLQPEFINTAELNYNQNIGRLSWFTSLYYINEENTIKPFSSPSATDPSVLVTTFINAKADIQYGIDNTLKYTLGGFSTTANFNAFNYILQTNTSQKEAWVYHAKMSLSYKFLDNYSAQINMNRDSKTVSLQGYRLPVQSADFALKRAFMNNRASIVFNINDIFNSRKFVNILDNGDISQTTMTRRDVRFYKITLQLPIGKPNASLRKKDRERKTDGKPDMDFSE